MNLLENISDAVLSFRCYCGRYGELSVPAMIARYGDQIEETDVLAKVRCKDCNHKGQGHDFRIIPNHTGRVYPIGWGTS